MFHLKKLNRKMLLVYTEKITNRIRYIFNLYLQELLNVSIDYIQ